MTRFGKNNQTPRRLAGLLLALLGLVAWQLSGAQTDPMAIQLGDLPWGEPGGGNGVPLGTRTAQMGIDPETGGVTYYALFPAGTHFDLHWHTHDEFVVVIQGTVTIELGDDTHTLTPGAYVVIPGKLRHSWDIPETGDVIILVRRAGPADFHFVGR